MSVELISAIFTGAVGLLTGAAGLNFSRNRRLEKSHSDLLKDFRTLRQEVGILRKLDLMKTRHIFAMEKARAAGEPIPEYPAEITALEKELEDIEVAAIRERGDSVPAT